jgi:hypothetical protein
LIFEVLKIQRDILKYEREGCDDEQSVLGGEMALSLGAQKDSSANFSRMEWELFQHGRYGSLTTSALHAFVPSLSFGVSIPMCVRTFILLDETMSNVDSGCDGGVESKEFVHFERRDVAKRFNAFVITSS